MLDVADIDAIEALARTNKRSVQEVTDIYTNEIARLKANARISNYLVLLASKHVRDVLRGASENAGG
jgi:predicted RecB family nuclease